MPNMSLKKVEMPVQDGEVRRNNFEEVALGYTKEMAMEEAQRCLHCPTKPCINGCPVAVNIPDFIEQVKEGNFEEAYQIIHETSSLPAVCGRVCPQEKQCEAKCVRGVKGEAVAIGRLERFVADWHRENVKDELKKPESNGHKVAVVGAGPAGLTCAGDLAKKGYQVSVFEALHVAGGVLMYGIPEFRLPKAVGQTEIEGLKQMGVDIQTNMVIGRSESVDDLFDAGYESVFIGSGAGLPSFMNMPGENLKGVYSANEFLTRCNLMKAYKDGVDTPIQHPKRAVIVGGGNVAMDAARCAKRLGVEEVTIVYRRSMDELPARKEEVEHAMEEGIVFKLLTNPVRVLGNEDGWVCGMECVSMELGEPDASGRRRPVEIKDSNFVLDVDCMIMAIGTSPNPLIRSTTEGLETNRKGCLIADDNGATTREGVFAGGDAVAARCAKHLGVEEVTIVYRRSMDELPARKEEVEHAMEEGIVFKLLTNPVRVLGNEDGWVCGMECVSMELGEPDASGRRRPVEIKDSNFVLDVDCMIMAIGTSPNPLIRSTTEGLETNRKGCLIADDNGATTREGVFAGGDAVTGAATVILAMGAGKTAAAAIDDYIQNK